LGARTNSNYTIEIGGGKSSENETLCIEVMDRWTIRQVGQVETRVKSNEEKWDTGRHYCWPRRFSPWVATIIVKGRVPWTSPSPEGGRILSDKTIVPGSP